MNVIIENTAHPNQDLLLQLCRDWTRRISFAMIGVQLREDFMSELAFEARA